MSEQVLRTPLARVVLSLAIGGPLVYGAYWWALNEGMGVITPATLPAVVGSVLILYATYVIQYGGSPHE